MEIFDIRFAATFDQDIRNLQKTVEGKADVDKFYNLMFGKPRYQKCAESVLTAFVDDHRASIERMWGELHDLFESENPDEIDLDTAPAIQVLFATREERWERFANAMSITVPHTFHVFRGVTGEEFLSNVLDSWTKFGDEEEVLFMPVWTLASWSVDIDQAIGFATNKKIGVVYEAHLAFDNTIADKWVDDCALLKVFPREREVISVAVDVATIPTHRKRAVVYLDGTPYRYEDTCYAGLPRTAVPPSFGGGSKPCSVT